MSLEPPHGVGSGARPVDLEALADRVGATIGAFGERAPRHGVARRGGEKPPWKKLSRLIVGVFASSLVVSLVAQPGWAGRGEWASTLRLDALFAIVWLPLLCWAMARQKLSSSLHVYVVLSLVIESFSEVMFEHAGQGGYWDSIMWPASVAWFGTLKELFGLPGASVSLFSIVTGLLLARALAAPRNAPPPPRLPQAMLGVLFGAIVLGWCLGLARGGEVEGAFRQTMHLAQLPLMGLLFLHALRLPDDLAVVGASFVLGAVARSLLVVWVYVGVCVPKGIAAEQGKPEWCTTHSDTVLFVSALIILGAYVIEHGARRSTAKALASAVVIGLGIALNNRRLAFVSLALASLVVYLALDASRTKRHVTRVLAVVLPAVTVYVLVGAESASDSALFRPAKSIASVLDQRDTSSLSRDIENENLIFTLARHPLTGQGFGHEYEHSPESPPVDLSEVFTSYRLIAHNGVLWLWATGGVLGFILLWPVFPMGATLAVCAYRAAKTPTERTAALSALGTTAVCIVQIWGDQGLSSYMTLFAFGVSFAVAARLALDPSAMGDAAPLARARHRSCLSRRER